MSTEEVKDYLAKYVEGLRITEEFKKLLDVMVAEPDREKLDNVLCNMFINGFNVCAMLVAQGQKLQEESRIEL